MCSSDLIAFAVPRTEFSPAARADSAAVPALLGRSLADGGLRRLYVGVFSLHFVLMASFLSLPAVFETHLGVPRESHATLYLPTLLLSLAIMVPMMIVAERTRRVRLMFLLGILLLAAAQFSLAIMPWTLHLVVAALVIFFGGFNYLEATLPSVVSKTVYAGGRGTALGVYSTAQFLGAFCGGAAGGWVLQSHGHSTVFMFSALVALAWWLLALGMSEPRNLDNIVYQFDSGCDDMPARTERLRALAGVEEVLVVEIGRAHV